MSGVSLEIVIEDMGQEELEMNDALDPYAGTALSAARIEAQLDTATQSSITFGAFLLFIYKQCCLVNRFVV